MNDKLKKILLLSSIIVIIIFLPITIKKVNNNYIIKKIKENYISQETNIENIDKKYIEKLYNKKNRNADEEFIVGYVYKEEIYYQIGYKKISNYTNKFVKYYLYNMIAKDYINIGNIKNANYYTNEALKNLRLNIDKKSYFLVWQSLIPYIDSENGREYIVSKTKEYIDKSKNDNNIYMLRKYMAPVLYLLGEREEAINNLFQVIFIAEDINDSFTNVKAIIDLASIFIDLQGYDWAENLLNDAMNKCDNVEDEADKISLKLYIYIQRCNIYYLTERYTELKQTINKIYLEDGNIPPFKYDDFLILAKAYQSIYMSKKNNTEESEKILKQSKLLLDSDKELLLSDKDIVIDIAKIELYCAKGEYNKAIKLCEELLEGFKISRSFRYEMIIMNKLRNLYTITNNINIKKLDESIENYKIEIDKSIMESYLANNLSEYKNIKNLNMQYKNMLVTMFIIVILILITVFMINMYKMKKDKNKLLEKDIEILNNQFKYQLSHYDSMRSHQDEVRLIWHDMKNHINTINGLFNDKSYEELKLYLLNLDSYVTELNSEVITKNKVLDAILFSKKQICNYKNIDFKINLMLPENLGIGDIDICIIFGNLIDNAIESCDRISNSNINKYISVKGGLKGNYFYIKIENSKGNSINKKGEKIISSKEDKSIHGLGITSVKNSISKYNGDMKIDYDENMFKVFIMIQRGS